MGRLSPITPEQDAGRLILTPHPVLLDGQTNVPADLRPGESLYAFLSRHVDLSEQWEVSIGGVVVPAEQWTRVKPKHGQIIEVRAAVGRQALMLVAMIALNYFTFGAGSIVGIGGAYAGVGAYVAAGTIYVAGATLVNNILTPKAPKPQDTSRDSVYSLAAGRNAMRPWQPLATLLGNDLRIVPDYASKPYTWYEGNDMMLGIVLLAGFNVHDIAGIYNGDTPVASYEGTRIYYSGIPGKPEQDIPLYSNAETVEGGALDKDQTYVVRTTPDDTIRVQVNIEGRVGDRDSKGRDHPNSEIIEAHYRRVGDTAWQGLFSRIISNAGDRNFQTQRVTLARDLPRGKYEIRTKRHFTAKDRSKGNWSAESEFQWTNMVAVRADEADYSGLGRVAVVMKATGQLTGVLDQIAMDAIARPVPRWTGTEWVTEVTSNAGARLLQWLRGIRDGNGRLVAGYGLLDEEIDLPSLQAFMVHCEVNGYTYDHYLRDGRPRRDTADAIAAVGFGTLSRETGRYGVVWAAADQPLSGVVNMATIKKGQFQVDYNLAEAADGVEYTYLDRETWSVVPLRVPAPGVEDMLHPAHIPGEGVTREGHAAELARWHLAQSLFQRKDIRYGTDLQHLTYKRMDLLALQHDLTQWGHGGELQDVALDGERPYTIGPDGQIVQVSPAGKTVTLLLDEPVPAPAAGNAYIGLRMADETVYRVFRIVPFEGESRTLTLADPWPTDAKLPGNAPDNPAGDSIWVYDFKATPGYRVRVARKEMEPDGKGARVMVVPETPELWHFVKTGEYIPAKGQSLLNTLPKARNVRVSEVQVVTGDVIHTELSVLFDVEGDAARTVVFAGIQGTEIRPVGETVTNQVRFRIGSAGTYSILVRPYSVDGIPGEAASVVYTTTGADIPPPPFDWFTVTVEPGGLRRYAWGYNQFQPADLAGAEIRFTSGTVPEPAWEAMTPLGEDGFFTSAFESDVPASGDWTFAIRARNTSGELSTPTYTRETLTHNVGENLEDHEERISTTDQIVQEMLSDFAAMNQQIADVQAEAQQAAADLQAEVDVLAGQLGDIMQADEWELAKEYPSGDLVQHEGKLYRALQDVPADTPITDTAFWEVIGDYSSLGEAVSAVIRQANHTATETEAHADMFNALGAMTPDGTAFLLNLDTAKVGPDESLAQRLSGINAAFGDANARIDSEEQARSDADSALAEQINVTQASLQTANLIQNPSFEAGLDHWQFSGNPHWSITTDVAVTGSRSLVVMGDAANSLKQAVNAVRIPAAQGDVFRLQSYVRRFGAGGPPEASRFTIQLRAWDASGNFLRNYDSGIDDRMVIYDWRHYEGEATVAHADVATVSVLIQAHNLTDGGWAFDNVSLERASKAATALAQLVDITRATVQENASGIAANTQSIAAANAAIDGKASANDLAATQLTVQQQGQTLSSHGQSINSLTASVGDAEAAIQEAREVSVSAVSGNAVINPSFESDDGWQFTGSNVVFHTDASPHTGTRMLRINAGSGHAINLNRQPVKAGQRIRIGGMMRAVGAIPNSGAQLRLMVRRYNADGSYAANPVAGLFPRPGSFAWASFDATYTVPSGTSFVSFQVSTDGHTSGAFAIDDVYLEPESNTLSEMMAKYTLAVQAGGDVAGMQLLAGGGISAIRFLASMFQVVDPSGGARTEFSNGNWRTYDESDNLIVRMGKW